MKACWIAIALGSYGLLKSMYSYDNSYPLDARAVGTVNQDGNSFEKIVFDSFHNGQVTGLLSLRSRGAAPYPTVLLLHGLGGNKSKWLGDEFTHGGQLAAGLLKQGFAILALGARYHGDRAVYNDYVDPADMVFERGRGMRYANMLTLLQAAWVMIRCFC